MTSKHQFVPLAEEAKQLGATGSNIISSKEIQVRDNLAALCNGEYPCPNYDLGASCPPYVEGPAEFRKWQAASKYSITVCIDVTQLMKSSGWSGQKADKADSSDKDAMSWVAGLVVLA